MKSETIRDKSTRLRKTHTFEADATQREQNEGNPDGGLAPSKLIVKFNREIHIVSVDDISYVESVKRKVFINTDSSIFEMYSTMGSIIEKLPPNFIRCHNSFLVNSARVAAVGASLLTLSSGVQIPVSRRYAREVRKQLRGLGV